MRPQKPRRGAHAALAAAFAEIGETARGEPQLGTAEVAAFLSVSEGTLYKALDPDQAGEFSYVRARQITERYRCSALAEDMAQAAGGVFVALDLNGKPDSQWQRSQCERLRAAVETIEADAEALADDNDIDAEEIAALGMIAKAEALVMAAVNYREALKARAKSALVPIRGTAS